MSNESGVDKQPPIPITTLRLPIFCSENKPFIFVKVLNDSDKYRVSVNPEFLKNYNLKFKILRDESLDNFIRTLRGPTKLALKIGQGNENAVAYYLKLPSRKKAHIQKHTIVLENDGLPGKTIIDKYQITIEENGSRNIIYIIDRVFYGKRNSSIAFISEEYDNLLEFLVDYNKLL